MKLKTYNKMCKHHGNDEGCNAAMDAMRDLLNQSGVLPIAVVQTTGDDDVEQEELKIFFKCQSNYVAAILCAPYMFF